MRKNKNFNYLLIIGLLLLSKLVFADQASNSNKTAAQEQARVNYRAYLEQLKVLNQQYKEVTGELKNIVQEEGLPVWDEKTDGLSLVKGGDLPAAGNMDIKETDNEMVLTLELPGLKKESIRVTLQDSKILKITAEKKLPNEPIERLIQLPNLAQEKGQTASYEDGILTVHIPKVPQVKKEISVPVL